jgi:sugar lactone lactonase YvrE
MRKFIWSQMVLILGLSAGLFLAGCPSNNSSTTTPKTNPTPAYSTTAVTVVSGLSPHRPIGICYDTGYLWFTTDPVTNFYLYEYSVNATPITETENYTGTTPFGIIYDVKAGPDGAVFVADYGNSQVEVFPEVNNDSVTYQTAFTGLTNIRSLAINSAGTSIYFLLSTTTPAIKGYYLNSTVPKSISTAGVTFTTTASGPGSLSSPQGMAMDSNGNVYVANMGVSNIVKYAPDGSSPVSFGSSVLTNPDGIVVDSAGNVLVSQYTGSGFIQEFTPSGSTYTAGVTFGNGFLGEPSGLALDGSGNLFVADYLNFQIVEFKNTN